MLTELGEGGANAGGLRFAIGQNQDRSTVLGIVTAGCSMGSSKGTELRTAGCTVLRQVARQVSKRV